MGFAFLAHPTESLEPGSLAGPDVVPYTETALTNAWRSPAILGLQVWNENDRYRAQPQAIDKTVMAIKNGYRHLDCAEGTFTSPKWLIRNLFTIF